MISSARFPGVVSVSPFSLKHLARNGLAPKPCARCMTRKTSGEVARLNYYSSSQSTPFGKSDAFEQTTHDPGY
ncbi:hypothetical protein PAXRUDRAFT_823282 [Paxillus rubicundulus Ve08.2h10]|uniref:Uncharacterized protein n=1 Tax=Paxillus rubicundulus Ve08.2h10 TaxID=930991 RepID=A0A0D0DVL8_9AGAM|nr:hypothetical protein PAXRUDRAFT_823282 [Paxillus rubicundulus Ve08.2h10]